MSSPAASEEQPQPCLRKPARKATFKTHQTPMVLDQPILPLLTFHLGVASLRKEISHVFLSLATSEGWFLHIPKDIRVRRRAQGKSRYNMEPKHAATKIPKIVERKGWTKTRDPKTLEVPCNFMTCKLRSCKEKFFKWLKGIRQIQSKETIENKLVQPAKQAAKRMAPVSTLQASCSASTDSILAYGTFVVTWLPDCAGRVSDPKMSSPELKPFGPF